MAEQKGGSPEAEKAETRVSSIARPGEPMEEVAEERRRSKKVRRAKRVDDGEPPRRSATDPVNDLNPAAKHKI